MRRVVVLGVVVVMAVAVIGFSMAAEKPEKAEKPCCPAAEGKCAAQGCCSAGAGCSAKTGCSAATACTAEGGCSAVACSAEGGCSAVACSAKGGCSAKKVALVCPVSGAPASKSVFVAFNGGKVFFGCQGCKAEFEKHTKKYAAKANFQLVSTGQFVQKGCPFSGRKTSPGTEISLGDVKVAFCCKKCQEKIAKAKADEQLEMVFSDKAFQKGFEIKKKPANKKEEEKKAG